MTSPSTVQRIECPFTKLVPGPRLIECHSEPEWSAARKIGSSDAARIVGAPDAHGRVWGSKLEVYTEKIGLAAPIEETENMKWGHRLEGPVSDGFQEDYGASVRALPRWSLFQDVKDPWLTATPDRICTIAPKGVERQDGYGVAELKTTGDSESDWGGKVPQNFQVQVQHQLMVTGLKWGVVVALFMGDRERRLRWFWVDRDENFIAAWRECAAEFWQRVEQRNAPEAGENDGDTIKRLFPSHVPKKVVQLGSEMQAVRDVWQTANDWRLQWKKAEDVAGNQLRMAIGDAEVATFPDGKEVSLREQERGAYEVKETSYRVLRLKRAKKED